jgi:hypothetical protein
VEYLGDPKFGIAIYRDQLPKELNIPQRLEDLMKIDQSNQFCQWREALVGHQQKMPEYRDCWDFKIPEQFAKQSENTKFDDLHKIYEEVKTKIKNCVTEYCGPYNITMNYMESINFVKYQKNQHFYFHADHGFSYVCTVSSIAYLNDDYEGGELSFYTLDLKHKPVCGDVIVFPSAYIYAHAALPVISGTKYSAVTMFDYNDDFHKQHIVPSNYQYNQSK